MESYGLISVLPMLILLALAIKTRKVLESVFAASIVAYLILSKQHFFTDWVGDLMAVAGGSTYVYVLLFRSLSDYCRTPAELWDSEILRQNMPIHREKACF